MDNISTLISKDDISRRLDILADDISRDFAGEEIFVISILKGSLYVTADLTRRIKNPCMMNFIRVSSYEGTESTGSISFKFGEDIDVTGKNVLIIEDIIDTGITLSSLREIYAAQSPAKLKIMTLLDKPSRRLRDITPDYRGFEIEDKFVVGYGLDCDEKYRNLDYIGVLNG